MKFEETADFIDGNGKVVMTRNQTACWSPLSRFTDRTGVKKIVVHGGRTVMWMTVPKWVEASAACFDNMLMDYDKEKFVINPDRPIDEIMVFLTLIRYPYYTYTGNHCATIEDRLEYVKKQHWFLPQPIEDQKNNTIFPVFLTCWPSGDFRREDVKSPDHLVYVRDDWHHPIDARTLYMSQVRNLLTAREIKIKGIRLPASDPKCPGYQAGYSSLWQMGEKDKVAVGNPRVQDNLMLLSKVGTLPDGLPFEKFVDVFLKMFNT